MTAAAVLGPRQAGIWRLAGEPSSVAIFRRIARAAARSEAQAEAAALFVSELVTNAIVHTRSGLPGGTVAIPLDPDEDISVGTDVVVADIQRGLLVVYAADS